VIQTGEVLPRLVKEITHEGIRLYGEAAGDLNPLHLDPKFAAKTQFGGAVAHGMLLLGYISEMMTIAFGPAWAASGKLEIRFRRPARPGDTVAVSGAVTALTGKGLQRRVTCAVQCQTQDGVIAATGHASLLVPTSRAEHRQANRPRADRASDPHAAMTK